MRPGLFGKGELEVSAMLGQSSGSSDPSMVEGVMLTERSCRQGLHWA